jgi:hypothetical protein
LNTKPTEHQHFVLILSDIAMAAAIETCDSAYVFDARPDDYVYGKIRDGWIGQAGDEALRRRVTALASAAATALAKLDAEQLLRSARRYGIPLSVADAERISEHFSDRRDAVLTYRR